MSKSSKRKKAIARVGDRILAPNNKWGTVTGIASKGLYPYTITWDNGHSENYSAANFEKYQYQVCPPDPAAEDIEEEDEAQLDLDFSREQEWKVGDRFTASELDTNSLPEYRFYIEADGQVWDGNKFTSSKFDAKTYNIKGIKAAVYQLRLNPLVKELKRREIPLEIKERFKCSDNSTCVAASELDSHSQESSSEDLPLLAYVREMNTAETFSQSDILACPSIQTFKQELATVGQGVSENSTLLQLHHPVNPSQSKENDSEPMTKETVSPQLLEQSPQSNQSTSRSKMCEDFSPVLGDQATEEEPISTTFSVIFPAAGTMSNGKWSAQASIAQPSLDNEFFWLESPGALSSTSRAPGQSRLEWSLKKSGLLQDGECINPIFLEDSFSIPLGYSDPLELRTAAQLFAAEEKPLETVSILAWQQSPYEESSTSTVSLRTEEELTPVDDSAVGKHFWCDRLDVVVEILMIHNWRQGPRSSEIIKGARCRPWWNKGFPDVIVLPLADLEEIEEFSCPYVGKCGYDDLEKKSLEKSETHTSKQTGSLYKDTEWRTNKAGEKIQYPRVDGERDPENDNHWYWYISYVVRDGNHKKGSRKSGGWKDTTAYIPRKNLSLCRELMREQFPVELTVEVCQIKWLWSQRRGGYLIGESKPEACPRLIIVDFQSKELFVSGLEWGESTPAKRHAKQRLIGEAIAAGKPLTYIKEVVANQ